MIPDPEKARQILFEEVENQLVSPDTPEVRAHFERLLALGIPEVEVRTMIASALLGTVTTGRRNGSLSYPDYIALLEELPWSLDETLEDDELMEDDYFVPILFEIESTINARDREARDRNIVLTDSQVRSILNKVRKHAGGGAPKVPRNSERDLVLASIFDDLLEVWTGIELVSDDPDDEAEKLPVGDWVSALRRIEDSVRTHTAGSGSRAYLDFLDGFMSMRKEVDDIREE